MRPVLKHLLTSCIDYAGLFPPAQLPLEEALEEYLDILSSDIGWMADRFIVSASQLGELAQACQARGYEPENDRALEIAVVGTPVTDPAQALESLKNDLEETKGRSVLAASGYEVKFPTGDDLRPALSALKKSGWLESNIEIYLEFPLNAAGIEAIEETSALDEAIGFKARLGGTTPEAFPNARAVANFILTAVSVEAPFKFTAGLHHPYPTVDNQGFHHHGFINVLTASALAYTFDLNVREIEDILTTDDPQAWRVTDKAIQIADHNLTIEFIEDFWDMFGGFGSCSIEEPAVELKKLGYF